jgi:hypothetical protein
MMGRNLERVSTPREVLSIFNVLCVKKRKKSNIGWGLNIGTMIHNLYTM